MTQKTIALAMSALMLAGVLAGCGQGSGAQATPAPTPAAAATTEYQWDFGTKNNSIDDLKQPCDQQGTVVELEYDTPAYAVNDLLGLDETLHKKVCVYLPYGYDESKQYNILYLLHGTEGDTDGPMEEFWLKQWGDQTLPVLDNMIAQGLCDPVIVVTPTYYSRVEDHPLGEAEAKALAEKLGDSYIGSEGEGDELEQNIWPEYFGQELRNNIIPAVESQYSTYANKDTSEENLIATRDHRAFAGLSRGAMTVCRSGLIQNSDIISWFGSFSGVWTDFDRFQEAMEVTFKDYPINFWYNGNGRGDFALENHEEFRDQTLEQLSDKFTDGENYAFVTLRDGGHIPFRCLRRKNTGQQTDAHQAQQQPEQACLDKGKGRAHSGSPFPGCSLAKKPCRQ